ncbi:MAG: DUF2306 domain-containing protein [Chthoniobacterales bacterium]
MNELVGFARARSLSWPWKALLLTAFLSGTGAIIAFAIPYFSDGKVLARFGESRRFVLYPHICAAGIALLVGPSQFWMGWTGRGVHFHRKLGMLYLLSVTVASFTAVYLTATTGRGLVFGFALGWLTLVWMITTALAYAAIKRRHFLQHWEWMIRSYVLTFVFVTFRFMVIVMKGLRIGSSTDRLMIGIWLSWVGPLLLTEAILQGRKIWRTTTTSRHHPFRGSHAIPSEEDRQRAA